MITLTLSKSECQQLEATFKTTTTRRLRERCQAILMADRKRRYYQIAQDVGVSPRTVQHRRNAYAHGGLEGLTIQWASGRVPHIPAEFIPSPRSSPGSPRDLLAVACTVRTEPMPNWPRTSTRPKGLPSVRRPYGPSAPHTASVRTGPPTATSKAIRISKQWLVRN
jgi:hypothetical protein